MPKPMKISYSIVTYPRKERYLDQTVQSLSDTGFFNYPEHLPLRLIGGSPDSSHLSSYFSDSRFIVDPMTEEEAREYHWHGSGGGLHAIKGHRRSFHPFRISPDASFLMVMEDDIVFTKGWIPRLETTLKEIVRNFSDRFILSLYTPGFSDAANPMDAYRSGRLWVERTPERFYGVQAILYPLVIRDMYLYETAPRPDDARAFGPGKEMDRQYGRPHDLLLAAVMKSMKIPILSTAPCLVQHVGHSSGANSPPHQSTTFLERL
jgi:hypothetical protein